MSPIPHKSLLLDVGGTFIKCNDGRCIPIDSDGRRASIVASLRDAVAPARDNPRMRIAVAIPGPFEYEKGIFRMKHKFASVFGERFSDLAGLSEVSNQMPGLPRFVYIHDVHAMLLGALQDPALKAYRRVGLITLGTGLGFAVSVGGIPQCSPTGSPAYSIYKRPYKDGIAEDFVSKRGAMRAWCEVTGKRWPKNQTVKDIVTTPEGEAAFALMGTRLAEVAAPMLKLLGIEYLLLGGQIAKSYHLMEESLCQGLGQLSALRHFGPLPDMDTASFRGLASLLN